MSTSNSSLGETPQGSAPNPKSSGGNWLPIGFTVVSFVAFFAVLAAGLAFRSNDSGSEAAPKAEATGAQTIEIVLGDIYVEPNEITIPAGTELTLVVHNEGAMQHDLKLNGEVGTGMIDPGESETVNLGVFSDSALAWCTVPGHRAAGMELAINVEGGGSLEVAAPSASGQATTGAKIDFNASPDEDWKPYDPNLAPAPGGTHHEVTFSMTETVLEIAPGVTQELWTFDDMVPGPTLRGKVGDIFTVTIVNNGQMGHSIDFHASKVAWDNEMRTIQPGESLVYQFEAKHSGIFMYHCGTAPALHHVGNGMHGALIIDPPNLPEVDKEFLFVQSEFYTGPEGEPGDYTKMLNDQWDAVVFNGYVNQYVHAPIKVGSNDRIRIWLLDNGPSENSSWHIIGTIFDTVYKEGAYLLRPDDTHGGSQALDLQPAQGGFVEATFDFDGLYPFVTHKFSNASKGAMGIFQVGDVEAGDDLAH